MSWIRDVIHELSELDLSKKSLRKFGITVGIVFILIGLLIFFKLKIIEISIFLDFFGISLFIAGIVNPKLLTNIFKIWMGFAFALGWIISRVILTILFYFIISPIGLLSKLIRKSFLDLQFTTKKESFWIRKQSINSKIEKMY
jgi:hypothetical protein